MRSVQPGLGPVGGSTVAAALLRPSRPGERGLTEGVDRELLKDSCLRPNGFELQQCTEARRPELDSGFGSCVTKVGRLLP